MRFLAPRGKLQLSSQCLASAWLITVYSWQLNNKAAFLELFPLPLKYIFLHTHIYTYTHLLYTHTNHASIYLFICIWTQSMRFCNSGYFQKSLKNKKENANEAMYIINFSLKILIPSSNQKHTGQCTFQAVISTKNKDKPFMKERSLFWLIISEVHGSISSWFGHLTKPKKGNSGMCIEG